jgi:hypothetical protein
VVGSCEYGNEPSDSLKGCEFHDQLRNCWLHKESRISYCCSELKVWVGVLGFIVDVTSFRNDPYHDECS